MKPIRKEIPIAALFLILLTVYSCCAVLYRHSHVARGCVVVHYHANQISDVRHEHDFNEINLYPLPVDYEPDFICRPYPLLLSEGKGREIVSPHVRLKVSREILHRKLLRAPPQV